MLHSAIFAGHRGCGFYNVILLVLLVSAGCGADPPQGANPPSQSTPGTSPAAASPPRLVAAADVENRHPQTVEERPEQSGSVDAVVDPEPPEETAAWPSPGELPPFKVDEDQLPSRVTRRLVGHRDWITALAFVSDDRVVSASRDGSLRIWNVNSGEELVHAEDAHDGGIECVAVSATGRQIASGGVDGRVCIWDATTGRRLREITDSVGPVHAVAYAPSGEFLAVADVRRDPERYWTIRVRLYNLHSGGEQAVMDEGKDRVIGHFTCLAVSPDSNAIAAGTQGGQVLAWEAGGKLVSQSRLSEMVVSHTSFQTGELMLASASLAGPFQITDIRQHQKLAAYTVLQPPLAVALTPDAAFSAFATVSGVIPIRSNRTGQIVRELLGHEDCVTALALSSNGRQLISGGVGDKLAVLVWE